ncbi:unnamed protein product [Calicophoron daubneyi]|uniref:Kinesin-like protein n=1 Tax=Calicophoron daubneyi TaxID=300641 RepID=A0AAV2SXX7_CALDB
MSAPITRTSVLKEAITVVCRIRPLNQTERMKGSTVCVTFPAPNTVAIGGKTYSFDVVLQPNATQTEVYEKSAKSIVTSVLNGYNGTIFAYGQTSSGKTYTMEGRIKDAEYKGVIPRIIEDIFYHIEKMDENLEFLIKVSYFELYMEKIRDLLDITKTNLPIHETKDHVAYVKGVTERFVSCADDVLDVLDEGKMNRHVSVTNMNEHSSRSHSIFRICIQQNNRENGKQLMGSLYLVDLAGSEKVSKSGAEGSTLDEAKNINKSLSTLGNVINSLVEGSTHIPYRDSKLTRILQQSLGGNSKTTIIIAASPAASSDSETKSTLVFGVRAKAIKNQVMPNAQLTADEWRRLYERETDRTKLMSSALMSLDTEVKRWREGERISPDCWYSEDNYTKLLKDIAMESAEIPGMAVSVDSPCFSGVGSVSERPLGRSPTPTTRTRSKSRVQNAELTDEERFIELFRLLDEKDDEINKQCQTISKLESQLVQTKEDYSKVQKENDRLQSLMEKAQRDADINKSEVKDVLQALEELAVTYDEKSTEAKKVAKELEEANAELSKLKEQMEFHQGEANDLKESASSMRGKLRDLIYSLNVELAESGKHSSKVFLHTKPNKDASVEEQVAVLKLYVLQLKSEFDTLQNPQAPKVDRRKSTGTPLQAQLMTDDFSELQREFERKTRELTALLEESERLNEEQRKRSAELETELSSLNVDYLRLKANRQLAADLEHVEDVDEKLLNRIRETVEQNSLHIQDQLSRARGDTERAIEEADKLREENVILKLQLERFVNEVDVLHSQQDGADSTKTSSTNAAREQAKSEIKAMEDTVMHELQILHSLRRAFIADLKNRIKKNTTKETSVLDDEPVETQTLGTALQREKINFLKTSLDNLTKVHKQLVRDNAELRCDIPKLEKRVKASMERIKDLESALRDSKEQSIRDKRRYYHEMERIKEVNWTRGCARTHTNIAKPIRPGQFKE